MSKPVKEEGGQNNFLKTDIGMVIMKLYMQYGNLFTCVALMIQVKFENWFQISFPRGILSTERGQSAFKSFDSYHRSLIECFLSLGNVVHKFSEVDLDWFGRVKLIDCICNLVLLHPLIVQTMIERLFLMLKDMDYRVRLFLARRIDVLFQTWDGHEELFHDI